MQQIANIEPPSLVEGVPEDSTSIRQEDESSIQLKAALRYLADSDTAYWDYSSIKSNSNPQAYFQYPAMMVPRMQGEIIGALRKVFPETKHIFDPFAGSGTILVESLKLGLNCVASDINPMAILLCKVKSQPFCVDKVNEAFRQILLEAESDRLQRVEIQYINSTKWFSVEALQALSKFRRAIQRQSDLLVRRFLWVAFAEAVRITSNSRTSTYKLHMREASDIAHRQLGVWDRIKDTMSRVVTMYATNYTQLKAAKILVGNHFPKTPTVVNHDIRQPLGIRAIDALISSPPYGDNHTTVTYGQHSFLPLLWIPLADIDDSFSSLTVANTHTIDSASLGGLRQDIPQKRESIVHQSDSLARFLADARIAPDAQKRVVSFFYDLDLGLKHAIAPLKSGGPIILTLGNRCVSGQKVPTDKIVEEFLQTRGCEFIDTHDRAIPTKRMAHRNQSAGTMLTETLLVMRGPR